jgi:DNA repair photolyase
MRLLPIANPPNPWALTEVDYLQAPDPEDPDRLCAPGQRLQVFEDQSREILSKNDSPDLGFTWSVNPYRGCFHACAYCYARPTHQYLSFGAGTDFDRKLVIKREAPRLLRVALERPSWKGELLVFSGVTDCYQPIEATFALTRRCLEVCLEYKQPVGIITKGPLVERDIDVLSALHRATGGEVHVTLSVPFWSETKARAIEPFVATPQRRIRTIERLAAAGIDVGVSLAPLIPGLSEEEIAPVLRAAREAGATRATFTLLRLPGPVATVFEERLSAALPLQHPKVMRRIRETRGGALDDPRFGLRGRGEGVIAETLGAVFQSTARKLGFAGAWSEVRDDAASAEGLERKSPFERPERSGQMKLFG